MKVSPGATSRKPSPLISALVGAVMGSKNLKAIAVRGTRGVGNIDDPKAFMDAVNSGKKVLAENAVTGQGAGGTGRKSTPRRSSVEQSPMRVSAPVERSIR